jgi:transposase
VIFLVKDKVQIRKTIIKLHKKGKKQTEISYLLDIPQSTISYWIIRYKETKKLTDKPRSGKPPKLSKPQLAEVKKELLDYPPKRFGGESVGWTTKMAIKFIKDRYNVKYSIRRMQELFHKFGLNLITPRSEYYCGSKLARNTFRDEFKKNLKQNMWISSSLISTRHRSD